MMVIDYLVKVLYQRNTQCFCVHEGESQIDFMGLLMIFMIRIDSECYYCCYGLLK